MRMCSTFFKIAGLGLPPLLVCAVILAAPPSGTRGFTRADVSAADLVDLYGLNIYKFNLRGPGRQTYRLVLREKRQAGQRWKNLFAEDIGMSGDPTAILIVSFTRQDGRFGGVFFRGEAYAHFSVKLCDEKRCYAGMRTTLPVPLSDCDDMVLFVHNSETEAPESGPNTLRLLTMKPSTRRAEKSGDAQHPRAELLLESLPAR